jgi:hypothetical protein
MADFSSDLGAATDVAMADTFTLARVFRKSRAIFRRRFVPVVGVTVVAAIPQYLAVWRFPPHASRGAFELSALAIVASVLAAGVVSCGVVQELHGRRFRFGESVLAVLRRPLPVLGVVLCLNGTLVPSRGSDFQGGRPWTGYPG